MKNKENAAAMSIDPFTAWTHRAGRIFIIIFCIYVMAIPLVMCATYNVWPTFTQMLPGALALLAVNVPVGIAEVGSFTPILGSSCYLTFATGNLMNLKIPCALNAQKVANVEQNTVEGDAIALISTCIASIVTLIVLFAGVLLIAPLKGFLQGNEFMSTASDYLLPALYGCMTLSMFGKGSGPVYVKNRLWIAALPALIVTILTIMGIASSGVAGFLIILMIPVSIGCARILWKIGFVRVVPNPNYRPPQSEEGTAPPENP